MYTFVIGIDRRTGRLGADLERHLRTTYSLCDFIIEGIQGGLELTSVRALAMQTDCLLEAICDYPASYYIALSTARVVFPTVIGLVPTPITVLTAIDTEGQVLYDCIEPLNHWVPPSQRDYSRYRNPDLLDFVGAVVRGLDHPEHMPA